MEDMASPTKRQGSVGQILNQIRSTTLEPDELAQLRGAIATKIERVHQHVRSQLRILAEMRRLRGARGSGREARIGKPRTKAGRGANRGKTVARAVQEAIRKAGGRADRRTIQKAFDKAGDKAPLNLTVLREQRYLKRVGESTRSSGKRGRPSGIYAVGTRTAQ